MKTLIQKLLAAIDARAQQDGRYAAYLATATYFEA